MLPIGTVLPFAGTALPASFLYCDGAAYSTTGASTLYAAISDTYNKPDTPAGSFCVPDYRGRALIGAGSGESLTPRALGDVGGAESVQLTTAQLPAHAHALRSLDADADHNYPAGRSIANAFTDRALGCGVNYRAGAPNADMAGGSIADTGNNQAHQNMQPFAVCNYIIQA